MRKLLATALLILTGWATAAEFSIVRDYVRLLVVSGEQPANGSVVVLAPRVAVTAAHALTAAKNRKGQLLYNGSPVEVIFIDKENDIMLIAGGFLCPCAPLGKNPEVDDRVVAVGFPEYESAKTQMLTEGLVQRTELKQYVISSTFAAPGSSGGGLFARQDGEWRLVGITIMVESSYIGTSVVGMRGYQQLNNMTFSAPVSTVRRLLERVAL